MHTLHALARHLLTLKPSHPTPTRPHYPTHSPPQDLGFNDFSWRSSDLKAAWPNVNSLIPNATRIDTYYTQPICTPTRGAFMSGRHPIRLGLQHGVITGQQDYGLPLNESTLANKLKGEGYRTIGVGKWHLGMYNWASCPTERGFDHFYGYFNGAEDYLTHEVQGYLDLQDDRKADWSQSGNYSALVFQRQVEKRIREHKAAFADQPLFLYYPMQTCHEPLEALDVYLNSDACKDIPNADRQTFCGMAHAADDAIGNLTKILNEVFVSQGEDVVMVIGGDNGGLPTAAGNNYPLRGHKAELWEGGVRNNAMVWSPTLLPAAAKGSVYEGGLVHVMDWHATFRDLAGAKDKAGFPSDGHNVWQAITTNASSPRTEFLHNIDPCSGHGTCQGVEASYRFGDWKLLTGVSEDTWYPVPTGPEDQDPATTAKLKRSGQRGPMGSVQWSEATGTTTTNWLFDVKKDPYEQTNVYDANPDVVKQIKAKIDALAAQAMAPCNVPDGSCYANDPAGTATLQKYYSWYPWAADPTMSQ